MTTAQLSHLRAIDAHLAKLLDIAAKRTPGEWKHNEGRRMLISVDSLHEDAVLHGDEFEVSDCDAAFIASCAGNAEAGWKATRAAIKTVIRCDDNWREGNFIGNYDLLQSILAAFPLESLNP